MKGILNWLFDYDHYKEIEILLKAVDSNNTDTYETVSEVKQRAKLSQSVSKLSALMDYLDSKFYVTLDYSCSCKEQKFKITYAGSRLAKKNSLVWDAIKRKTGRCLRNFAIVFNAVAVLVIGFFQYKANADSNTDRNTVVVLRDKIDTLDNKIIVLNDSIASLSPKKKLIVDTSKRDTTKVVLHKPEKPDTSKKQNPKL